MERHIKYIGLLLILMVLIINPIKAQENQEECRCLNIDIKPETVKKKGGNEINFALKGGINSTDSSKADIEIDINWIINMICVGKPGPCQASVAVATNSQWIVDGAFANVISESITPANIPCQGICDESGHTTNNIQNVKTTYKTTIQKADGTKIKYGIQGQISISLTGVNCPGSWNMMLHYSAHIPDATHKINWAKSDYDGDGKTNNQDRYPLDPNN